MKGVWLFTLWLVAALVGCGGATPATQGTASAVEQTSPSAFEVEPAFAIVDSRVPLFPKDTTFVGFFRADFVWSMALEFMPQGSGDEDVDALKRSLADAWFPGIGNNPLDAESVTLTMAPSGLTLIFDGEFEAPQNLPSSMFDGRRVYSLHEIYPEDSPARGLRIYLTRLEDRPGVAIYLESTPAENGRAWPASIDALWPDVRASLEELMQMVDGASIVGVSLVEGQASRSVETAVSNMFRLRDTDFPPKSVVGFGEDMSLGFLGNADELTALERDFDKTISSLKTLFEQAAKQPRGPSSERLSGMFFDHFAAAFVRDVEKERGEGSLLYTAPSPQTVGAALFYYEGFASMVRTAEWELEKKDRDAEKKREVVKVVKARENIEAGAILYESMVVIEEVPLRFLPPDPVLAVDLNIYIGAKLPVAVEKGAMILTSDFKTYSDWHHEIRRGS